MDEKNVFVWGTFDIIHQGHISFLEKASQYGNLYVILMPDARIRLVKKNYYDENQRKDNLLKINYVKDVFISSLPDNLECLDLIKPDLFVFGYDQRTEWESSLIGYLKDKGIDCNFIWFEKFGDVHSSDLRKEMRCHCGSGDMYKDCCGK